MEVLSQRRSGRAGESEASKSHTRAGDATNTERDCDHAAKRWLSGISKGGRMVRWLDEKKALLDSASVVSDGVGGDEFGCERAQVQVHDALSGGGPGWARLEA